MVGCVVVLSLFAVLAYTGLRIARRVDDPFRRLAAAGVTTWLVGQAVINIGGVVGLLPITGLPLPFISDGGSALVVTLAGDRHAGLLRPRRTRCGPSPACPSAGPVGPTTLGPVAAASRPASPTGDAARWPRVRAPVPRAAPDDQAAPRGVRQDRSRGGTASERRR